MSVFLFFSVLQTENKINDLRIATMHAIDKKLKSINHTNEIIYILSKFSHTSDLLTRPAIVRVDFFKIPNVI